MGGGVNGDGGGCVDGDGGGVSDGDGVVGGWRV